MRRAHARPRLPDLAHDVRHLVGVGELDPDLVQDAPVRHARGVEDGHGVELGVGHVDGPPVPRVDAGVVPADAFDDAIDAAVLQGDASAGEGVGGARTHRAADGSPVRLGAFDDRVATLWTEQADALVVCARVQQHLAGAHRAQRARGRSAASTQFRPNENAVFSTGVP
eukprot:511263-Pleurochrysis_carterae.AAC.2